jgi:peptidoglycan/xylan/chitin deacetylase (PgdA/CDA1 family)
MIKTQIREKRYRISWAAGSVLCGVIYFSGILYGYEWIRKKILKRYRTTIITYHSIKDDGKDPDISVSPKKFLKQMEYLKQNCDVVSLSTVVGNIGKACNLSEDRAVITFDDGFKDNLLNAYPILQKYELPATIFLISQCVGRSNDSLNSEDIKMMKKNNIEFGSHTANHKILSEVDFETAVKEIAGSKKELEHIVGGEVAFFAYPKGKKEHFNSFVKKIVEKAGYRAAVSTENGEIKSDSDLFELKRVGIRNYPVFVLRARISGIFEIWPIYLIRSIVGLT